eukprot:m.894841 g.894841  ORF g.894841 m.894841 type:complete len:215 (-) comp59989_c0_seq8:2186-2830(-)
MEFYDGSQQQYPYGQYPQPVPQPFNPAPSTYAAPYAGGMASAGFDEEPPLLEELGINFDHIWRRTMFVLHPTEQSNAFLNEADLAGPLIFCLLFASCLLARGKMHFGYIYGLALIGCLGLWAILSLMSSNSVSLGLTASVLGYCLLPMVALAGISLLLPMTGIIGTILSVASICWCAYSAAKMFAAGLNMFDQRLLIAYPCLLLYGVFALMTVF